jgi:hypothetical protein
MDKTIDLTPTWLGILPALVALITDGDAEGRRGAQEELRRMAGLADAHVTSVRNLTPFGRDLRAAFDAGNTEEVLRIAKDLATRL